MYYIFKLFEGCFIEFQELFIGELIKKIWEKNYFIYWQVYFDKNVFFKF